MLLVLLWLLLWLALLLLPLSWLAPCELEPLVLLWPCCDEWYD